MKIIVYFTLVSIMISWFNYDFRKCDDSIKKIIELYSIEDEIRFLRKKFKSLISLTYYVRKKKRLSRIYHRVEPTIILIKYTANAKCHEIRNSKDVNPQLIHFFAESITNNTLSRSHSNEQLKNKFFSHLHESEAVYCNFHSTILLFF